MVGAIAEKNELSVKNPDEISKTIIDYLTSYNDEIFNQL